MINISMFAILSSDRPLQRNLLCRDHLPPQVQSLASVHPTTQADLLLLKENTAQHQIATLWNCWQHCRSRLWRLSWKLACRCGRTGGTSSSCSRGSSYTRHLPPIPDTARPRRCTHPCGHIEVVNTLACTAYCTKSATL